MQDISGFGIRCRVIASTTFPVGFDVTQFADDADPFDIPEIQIADKAMGINGDLIVWSQANPIEITLNVVPSSDDDRNLNILFQANRVGKDKPSIQDVITIAAIYPNGDILTLINGKITNGMPGKGVQNAGRMKSRGYSFVFENYIDAI